ncbi:MAG: glycosyl hydrolase, partial [Flammeovirgaceae bacterium]|nr:glycosyl hydrolase [Flammeovirgaceae bacterium]
KLSSNTIRKGGEVKASISLKNTGSFDVDEIVQLYITDQEASVRVPLFDLKGIQRVSLKAEETQQVTFSISTEMLQLIDEAGNSKLEKGEFTISVGGSLPTKRSLELGASAFEIATLTFK